MSSTFVRDTRKNKPRKEAWKRLLVASTGAIALMFLVFNGYKEAPPSVDPPRQVDGTQPLVMKGGDPHIRALMRMISASEANDRDPYSIMYGGDRISDLSRHPERCVPIVVGPNVGNCSTAAGRYQFLDTTWEEKAKRYHPEPPGFMFWKAYSFEAGFQDAVVYAWLVDRDAWGMDIPAELEKGNLERVLRRLSGTWTSLGYGIENNSMTRNLPTIYQRILQEELQNVKTEQN